MFGNGKAFHATYLFLYPLEKQKTTWKHQKSSGLLMFSGGIEKDYEHEMG